jgi:enediyne biosynthesis protein E4
MPRSSVEASSSSPTEPSIRFEEVTSAVGLNHSYRNGEESDQFAYIESIGGGLAVFDFDRDGFPDLFFPGGGLISKDQSITPLPGTLWQNDQSKRFTNVTDVSNTSQATFYSNGVASGDLNNDGFPDLLVTGYCGLQFFVNQGDGTFAEQAVRSGLVDSLWSTSAGLGDLNNDGSLDIYVVHNTDWSWENHPKCLRSATDREICAPAAFNGLPDEIYLNNNDATFRPIGKESGLKADGRGLAVVLADLNHDSRLDIYVANDTTYNFLYANKGDAKFDEIGIPSGTGLDHSGNPNGSMGIAVPDFDGNLLPDLWVTNYENETCALYLNNDQFSFRCATQSTGIVTLGTLFVSFGTVSGDFDLDGDEDIVVSNGHVYRYPKGNSADQFPLLLIHSAAGKLVRQKAEASNYFGQKWRGRGVAAVDFDSDGDLDLAMSHINQPSALLENKTMASGNWCTFELIGIHANRDCVGARVVLKTNNKRYLRSIFGGGSYLTQNPYLVHFGFPSNETLEQAEITWPNGNVQVIPNPRMNAKSTFLEPLETK